MAEESVADFAVRAGLSPRRVRALIASGALRARRVGGHWLIDQSSDHRPAPSRALGTRMQAGLLAALSGQPSEQLSASERVRLRRYRDELLRSDEPDRLLKAWTRPTPPVRLRAADADLDDLARDDRVVTTGFSDPRAEMAAAGQLEARVAAVDAEALCREFLLRPSDQPNVLLHYSAEKPSSPLPLGLLLVDLAGHDGARERARVADLLRASS
ncbi:helix-turn-helix domain-containing protein [Curtobacterium sp. YC1]|uniref:helix-turn-helix domain-containing protein n=1 Tax=Curtobacterium sp. YC1 TaxID=2795488 RepID=UPI0018E5387B|nr:helix-turn-helix domain-containing protein [Curtobacterium sp. YC1]QQD76799.1 helix-turn-helix domain-containing protein [Curtobacterium sp. YC1]